ncbi:MAG: hypothetical protein ACRDD1_13280 [Planctomycetia bacterium]
MPLTEVDRHLLDRCLAHEDGAGAELVDRYVGAVYHAVGEAARARNATLQPVDFEALAAAVFNGLAADDFAVLREFDRKASLASYLGAFARRVALGRLPQTL